MIGHKLKAVKSSKLHQKQVEDLVMNFKEEKEFQFGLQIKSNKTHYYRPKIQTPLYSCKSKWGIYHFSNLWDN